MNLRPETEVRLNTFKPRPYQIPLIDALENKGFKKIICVMPRRAGKDIACFNIMIRQALMRVGNYAYLLPNAVQARRVMFDGITNDGKRILDFIPEELIKSINIAQMKIVLVNGSTIQFIGSENHDCFDDQTEILTDSGWKLFKDLNKSEKVATLVDGYLEFHHPVEYMEYDYNGLLYTITNKSMDFKVTPNHRFFVKSSKGVYKFKEISDPTIKWDMIPSTSLWKGIDQDTFYFPKVPLSPYARGRIEQRSMKMDHFVALLGIYLSEGSTYKSYKRNQITISQTKPIVREKIRSLLKEIGIHFGESKDRFTIECKQMHAYFSQFGLQHERFIPQDIKNLDGKYLQILFEWLIVGDGYKGKAYTAYYSTSKKLIDDVQEIIIKLGLSGNIYIKPQRNSFIRGREIYPKKTLYGINVRSSKFKRLSCSSSSYIDQIPYRGKVYCVSVPSGIIKVRRNGKEMWSGNSLRGTNYVGVVISEAAYSHPHVYPTIKPILAANSGWVILISTPHSTNHFYTLFEVARHNPKEWFTYFQTIEETRHLSWEDVEEEIARGEISLDMALQEYKCDFKTGTIGAYYSTYLTNMELNHQIGPIHWESSFPVHTAWDIGVSDSTAIIMFQSISRQIHVIDVYQNSNVGLEHYIKVLQSKPYTWGKHIAPHDIEVREFSNGAITRKEKASELGFDFMVAPRLTIADGIEAVRTTLPRMYINRENCKPLIEALRNYRKEYDVAKKVYKDKPYHDHHSHIADALRYLCVSLPKIQTNSNPEALNKRYYETVYGSNDFGGPFSNNTYYR